LRFFVRFRLFSWLVSVAMFVLVQFASIFGMLDFGLAVLYCVVYLCVCSDDVGRAVDDVY